MLRILGDLHFLIETCASYTKGLAPPALCLESSQEWTACWKMVDLIAAGKNCG